MSSINTEKVIVKVPWSKVATLVVTLVKSAKGGISKAEGEELLEQLADIVIHVAASVGKD